VNYYFVKRDLYGVPAGRVEMFADHRAGALLLNGDIEVYDEKKHGDKPGAPPRAARAEPVREGARR
jgi:hypothetical protein